MGAVNGYTNVTTLNDADELLLWQAGAVVNMTWSSFKTALWGTTITTPQIIEGSHASQAMLRITQTGTGDALVVEDSTTPDSTPWRVDANGRVTQGHVEALALTGSGGTPVQQMHATGSAFANMAYALCNWGTGAVGPGLYFGKGKSGTIGTHNGTVAADGDAVMNIRCAASDGADLAQGANLSVAVHGTVTASSGIVPMRFTVSLVEAGSSSVVNRLRVWPDMVLGTHQPATVTKSAVATLTAAEVAAGIIEASGTTYTLTLPTGSTMDGQLGDPDAGLSVDWSIINTASGTITLAGNTNHTIVGATGTTTGTSSRWRTRVSAANTCVTYRLA